MKKFILWIIIALFFLIFGGTLFVISMTKLGWDFNKIGSYNFETNTYQIVEDFNKIEIDLTTTDIEFKPSTDGQCKLICYENVKEKHFFSVTDGVLKITTVSNKKWYDYIHLFSASPKMTMFLPNLDSASLNVKISTGDIIIPANFCFESIEILGSTCNVKCNASTVNQTKINVTTGNILIENANAKNYDLKVSTGDIKITNASCENFTSTGTTGEVKLNNLIASNKIFIKRGTGDIEFYKCDASELILKTSTGDVEGSLLTGKTFIAKTDTGEIDIPNSTEGGKCEITTSTGDIEVNIVS